MDSRRRRTLETRPGRDGSPGEIDEEVAFHIREKVRHLVGSGMSEEEAWHEALRRFGDVDEVKAAMMRERRGRITGRRLDEARQDLRFGLRQLIRNPGYTTLTVLILALGIGATTAIFSLLDAALLSRPAVEDPSSLVAVYTTCRLGAPRCSSSYPDYLDYRDRTEAIADLAATSGLIASLGDEARGARLVRGEAVTGDYFAVIGVGPQMGRVLQPADDVFGAGATVAVLSHALWRDHFGGDAGVVGRDIRLNGAPFEVVGVAAREYRGLTLANEPDFWVPLQTTGVLRSGQMAFEEVWESRSTRWMSRLVGRLTSGATPEQARAELLSVSERLREEDPEARGPRSVTLDPLGRYLAPIGAEQALPQFVWLLMGVVGVTLLLACANLANLLLARASSRTAEMGVRIAIGAGRRRLVRQLLVESAMLSTLGGTAGVAVALGSLQLLGSFELPGGVSIALLEAGLDAPVLGVAAGLSMLTAALCGLVPALQATRPDLVAALRSARSHESRRGSGRLRRGLVAAQVALCIVLLVGSGLFVRTLRSALDADLGFQVENLTLARFNLALVGYAPEEALAFVQALRQRVLSRPGVGSAAVATVVPMYGGARRGTFAVVEGYEPAADEEMRIDLVGVTPGYFEALGVPLLAGRDFASADAAGATEVAIVNREMAERYWPGGRAVGGIFRTFGSSEPVQVVGVAEDLHWTGLTDEPTNFAFLPLAQAPGLAASSVSTLVARTNGDPGALLPELRGEANALEPGLSIELATMNDVVGDLLMPQRMGALLLSAFGVLALLLAAIGIAAVVSYTVGEQRRSIGVRMALGARQGQVLGSVLRGMAGPVALGLVVGLAAAALLDGAVEQFLYGVSPGDPVTYSAIAGGLAIVALVAALVPAREAARVDPLQVLKTE